MATLLPCVERIDGRRGCPNYAIKNSRCAEHQHLAHRSPSSIERNTPEFQRLRRRLLKQRGSRCERCGRAGGVQLHHKLPVAQGGRSEPENLVFLCTACHRAEHATAR